MFRATAIATSAAFIALAVALGFALAAVPNVELLTLTVFLAGGVLGAGGGAWVGVATGLVYSLLNPWGAPTPLVLAAQLLGLALVGGAGGWIVRRIARLGALPRVVALGGCGFVLTFVYDLLTNVGAGLQMGAVVPALASGLPFSMVHWLNNTLAFAVLGGPSVLVLERLGRLRA